MTGTPSEAGLGTWQVLECPWQIEYSPPILDEIRRIAVDAFFSLPRGGAEIGGILYGTQKDGIVRILAFRAMECEHAFGPTFVLSDKDKARLGAQLEELTHDLALRGLAVVGWYHTHTRSEIFLSEPDLEIYNRFFPLPWQVALVLRPAGMKPTRAGFFFRNGDGAIRNETSHHEFVVGGLAGGHPEAGARPANGKSAAAPAPTTVAAPEPSASAPPAEIVLPTAETAPLPAESTTAIVPATAKNEPELNGSALPAATLLPSSTELVSTRRQLEVSAPAVEAQRPDFVPPAFLIPPEKHGSRTWLWVLLAVVAVGAGGYFTSSYWIRFFSRKPAYLHLQAMDQAGQLRIQWDRESLAPLDLKGGTIEIVDGPATTTIPLDPPKIRSGSFQYVRRSDMVEVHMTVRTGAGSPLEEFTSFVGQPPPRQASPQDLEQQQQTAALATQAERSRADLLKEQMRRLELEESLKKMQDALRREEERRRAEKQIPAPSAPPNTPRTAPAAAPTQTANNAPNNNGGASQAGGTQPASASTAAPKPPPAAQTPAQPPASAPTQVAKPPAAPEKAPEQTSAMRPNTSATPAVVNKPPAGPALPSLSGRWVFSRASKTGSPFPPDSVTLAMTEAYGQVRGIFVGKYRAPKSRKFPATVKFNFEGAVRPSSSKFSFTGDDGMTGEIELIRLPGKQDAIEVVWYSERDKLTFDDIFFRLP